MLPLDLLLVVRRGSEVKPRYLLDTSPAETVLRIYRSSPTLGEARAALRSTGGDKVMRGLAHVLERMLVVEEVDRRLVMRVRLELFREAARRHPVVDPGARRAVVDAVAARLGLTPSAVEELMAKAHEDNLRIVSVPDIGPGELAARYNTSLAQTLLFRAVRLAADVYGPGYLVKEVLRRVKRLGLMYVAEQLPGGVRLAVDGPASVLRQTERYGTRMAKVLPVILSAGKWSIRADVKLYERTYTYVERSDSAPPLAREEVHEAFDSRIEEEFYRQLARLCRVEREPDAVVVGNRVFIPDFKVGDLYIEVVGFWTPQYLEEKYGKLMGSGVPLLVLVDERLAVRGWSKLPHYVVAYRDRPRIGDVYKYIRGHCVGAR